MIRQVTNVWSYSIGWVIPAFKVTYWFWADMANKSWFQTPGFMQGTKEKQKDYICYAVTVEPSDWYITEIVLSHVMWCCMVLISCLMKGIFYLLYWLLSMSRLLSSILVQWLLVLCCLPMNVISVSKQLIRANHSGGRILTVISDTASKKCLPFFLVV